MGIINEFIFKNDDALNVSTDFYIFCTFEMKTKKDDVTY